MFLPSQHVLSVNAEYQCSQRGNAVIVSEYQIPRGWNGQWHSRSVQQHQLHSMFDYVV